MRITVCVCLALFLLPLRVEAQDKSFVLAVPDTLNATGFPDHLLPRFSLKTSVRINRVGGDDSADLAFSTNNTGTPVFQGPQSLWHLEIFTETANTVRFVTWLESETGARAITGFQPDGTALFSLPDIAKPEIVAALPTGDVVLGERLALTNCGRCHVVNESNRMKAIGSTPSFALIRTFDDWQSRFESFYVLKPHPAFTQIKDVTPPFDPARPSPIAPLTITLDELDAIIAYEAIVEPADLGAPLQSQ